ncbi:hypothetical protein O7599_02380 [Streptomyces sp. WMMC500]|uniref:hypothetical protein n=1 Tax=Streptomyces sp. WMMC500 TaxID=3015154 RepID=UPI00248CFCC4|nr:hypothetical protein [Streptomyces sp. WMMC500]WBB61425.1 hypothetical protein O7599_02380 [Streptomyces sp. WMMC500]
MRTRVRTALAVAVALVAGAALAAPAAAAAPAKGAHEPRWEISLAGSLPDGAHLNSVTSAGRDAWAVGSDSHYEGMPDGVVLHWDGGEWQEVRDPALPPVYYWNSVDASSPQDVWAYGWNYDAEFAVHYDGYEWEQVPLPELPGGVSHGSARIAAEDGRVWLVGDRYLSTYAQGDWTTQDLPSGVNILDADARSSRTAWAVGGFAYAGRESRPVVMRWKNGGWRETEAPDAPGLRLTDVHVDSARSVWATGRVPAADGEGLAEPRVYHYDGHRWRDVTGPVAGIFADAVTGDGRGGIWLSGDPHGWEGPPVLWHYDGRRWTRHEGATVTAGETQSYEVNGLAPGGRRGGPWAVGSYERIEGTTAYQSELIERLQAR